MLKLEKQGIMGKEKTNLGKNLLPQTGTAKFLKRILMGVVLFHAPKTG